MAKHYIGLFLVIFAATHFGHGQLDADEIPTVWVPEEFPSPDINPQICQLGQKKGFVCDPNRLLSRKEIDILDWLLRGVYDNDTHCPCSTWSCETKKKGFHMSVALAKKMKMPDSKIERDRAILQQASSFSFDLMYKNWKFGNCNESILIFYSKDDEVLHVTTGKTASDYLTNDMAFFLERRNSPYFKRGDTAIGLYYLVTEIRDTLNGNKYIARPGGLLAGGSGHITSGFMAALLLSLAAVILS